ncbi:MAG: TPM domain-containing protein [Flavobacteriales bacterium]|nr:TPM domain-containing protein [Flavobacteriales bacterium]
MLTAEDFLTDEERARVAAAIGEAERLTSGEIRVHVEDHIEEDVLDHAAYIFTELGMQHTRERNGVLIYVSAGDRLVAVVGDKGVNEKVPTGFWDQTLAVLKLHFAAERRADGLCEAVRMVAALLAKHYPPRRDDVDELSNEVSIGRR